MRYLKITLLLLLSFVIISCATNYTGRYLKIYNEATVHLSEKSAKNFTDFCIAFDKTTADMVERLRGAFKQKGYDAIRKELIKQKEEWKVILIAIRKNSNGDKVLLQAKLYYIQNDLYHWAFYYHQYVKDEIRANS